MKSNNFFKFLAASAMLLGTSVLAQGQQADKDYCVPSQSSQPSHRAPARVSTPSVTHDYDWYAAKTYTWTNANGQTQTAKLTDLVTDPYQMYDLLKWVYRNPEIPGTKFSDFTGQATYYGEQFYYKEDYWSWDVERTDPGWGITNSNVTAPNEDGHTIFLVKLKNYSTTPGGRTSSKSDLVSYFRNNVESIELLTNSMRAGEGLNAGTMFNIEGEFNRFFFIGKGKSYYCTPNWQHPDAAPYAPFYNMFEEYSPTTADTDTPINDFYERMNDGEIYPVIHDCTSVMHFDHYFSMTGKNGTEEKALSGMVLFIPDARNLNHDERNYDVDHQPEVGMYTIELGATATNNGDGTFNVKLDWTSTLNEMAKSEVPQTYVVYVYATDENGTTRVELVTTTETTYNYNVPQDDHSYTITYVVNGYATGHEAFHAWSNDAFVIIPGTEDFIALTLNHYESDFVKAEAKNYYRNFLGVINDVNAVTPENIDAGMNQILVKRFDADEPDAFTTVATITFTNNNGNVSYSIEYVGQDILNGYDLNTLQIKTSDNLGHYAAGEVVDLSKIMIVDQFAESVEGNNHPEEYGYVLTMGDKNSNDVPVHVTKVDATIDGYYTKEEVDADNDINDLLKVDVKSANFELYLENNARIYHYSLDRGNDVEVPNVRISYLQRRSGGDFIEMNDYLGNAGNTYDEGWLDYFDEEPFYGKPGHFLSYLPIAWTFGTDRVKGGENSYGSPVLYTGVGSVTGTVRGTKSAGEDNSPYFTWTDDEGNLCCVYNPIITLNGNVPEDASVEYIPYMYRVWRICDNVRNHTFDPNTHYAINDVVAEGEDCKIIAEDFTSNNVIQLGDTNDALAFDAVDGSDISFYVRFYYVKANRGTNENKYYVVDATLTWTDIFTGVEEISGNGEVVAKTYVNAQGIKSDKPFSGVNIVITRYSDGSAKTTKVVR